MSTTTSAARRRKVLAVGLALVGVSGLTVASAAQLDLTGDSTALAQAGTRAVTTASCQTTPVTVSFGSATAAGTLQTGTTFGFDPGADVLVLEGIAPACDGLNLAVALGDGQNAAIGTTYQGVARPGTVQLALNGDARAFGAALDAAAIERVAQVSVSIYER